MNWEEAKNLISTKIIKHTDINTDISTFRIIEKTNHKCNSYDYNGELGFKVPIGTKTFINIPWTMLQNCFNALSTIDGFGTNYFQLRYSNQYKDHDCHVHVVGMIFVVAGIATLKGRQYFLI